jgi:16S rRNA (uracil1498-N3)-methyltransferase
VVLALHESASGPLADVPVGVADSLMLIVGPEGGISDQELADLRAAGALSVRLGPSVLRTSTAAAVALGALGVLTPRWR